ncbi:MAG: DUF2203 domain-containing protein [Pirellulaceae bacterium]|nr:DUF2203 domain-containing protein [Pirellulaceae bacterium]
MVRAIGNNSDSSVEGEHGFTPTGATKMLPLVRRIVADLVELERSIAAQREQLQGVDSLAGTSTQHSYQEELRDIRASLAQDESRLQLCMEELTALGVKPHHPIDGGVDFPATINRRPVYLCWNLGEDSVHHIHELDQASTKRKQLDPTAFK